MGDLKASLFNGERQIKYINVYGMFRNNEKYIEFLTKTFETIESKYDILFKYFFIENNSTDRTKEYLKSFITSRKGSKLLSFKLKQDYKNVGDGRNFERISTLASIRNKLVDQCTPIEDVDWCLFIDSNIFFPEDILEKVFSPKKVEKVKIDQSIGMVTLYTQQLFIPEIHKINSDKPVLLGHYYDTYPFVDKTFRSHYPNCPFEKCKLCKQRSRGMNRELIRETETVVDVKSCFGGFVFILPEILNDKRIRWGTVSYEVEKDECLCEHILFCERLRLLTDKRIVILQDVDTLYRTF